MIDVLIDNLNARDELNAQEIAHLATIVTSERLVAPGQDIVPEGSRPMTSVLLLDGIAARYRVMNDGKRQITALHVPGDFMDLHAFLLKTMDQGVLALSRCRIAIATHSDLQRTTETMPHLTRLLWLLTVIDGAIHREWIASMGRRSTKAHLAHLICEVYIRLKIVGKTDNGSFHLALSQAVTADVLGISIVHLNKTLQSLRRDGVFRWDGQKVSILDWIKLTKIAEFDDTYLNLVHEPR
ncbi:Crp/Fnr family transcriptional regulator [Rhizobium sp. LjRoot98]|uniref:Crp/Fnr family transcriptional regulator n=1 Tax=unclassified Rhizobium TaxID=2613769 RepID=UPI000713D18C|nr:Crp/Fnr family transcriptional regulator [Rhizobium sp. Root1204]KQV36413.1 Crp/Fnr family transcriptional regulator [Rhizobium sp. Root1204]